MMPNVSYGPMLNSTMTRGASLGSGIRSLLGLGNARNFAGGVSRGINWSSLLNNTSKTLSVVREAIPIVKEVGPMMNNMKSMLKVASVFKDATDVNNEHKPNNNINNNNKICRLAFNENAGAPVIFPECYYNELLTLPLGKGGGFIAKKYPAQVVLVPAQDEYELFDIDTGNDLIRLSRYLR